MTELIKIVDWQILYFFNIILKNPVTDFSMPLLSKYGYLLFIPFIFFVYSKKEKDFYFLFFVLIVFLFSDFIGNTLKMIIARPRPYLEQAFVRNMEGIGKSYSMPSNHATNAFSVATFIYLVFRNKSIFLLAFLIALSRIFIGVHYPSDIVVGGIFGILIGRYFKKGYDKILLIKKERPSFTVFLLILFFISSMRILYIKYAPIDLSGDEAHYWEWSRNLDLSYYSKGPLIAYVIFLGTKIFGHTELGVRFFSVVFSFLSSLMMYKVSFLLLKDEKKSIINGLLIQIVPLFSYLGILMTIDSPFLFLWLLGLYVVCKTSLEDKFNEIKNWIYVGIIIGFGMLAKYTMVFFYPSLVIFLFFQNNKKIDFLKKPGLYLAILLTLLVFLPVLYWNNLYGWVTVKHTAYHARIAEGLKISFKEFTEFLLSQLGLITPFLFSIMFYAFFKIRNFERRFILSFFLPVFVFFTFKSIQGKVEGNWALVAYPSGLIAISYLNGFAKKIGLFSIIFACLITIAGYITPFLALPLKLNPAKRIQGWANLEKIINIEKSSMPNIAKTIIFTDDYQLSSLLSFYLREQPFVFCVNFSGRRMNQYDIWSKNAKFNINSYKGYDALFVTKKDYPFYEYLIKNSCKDYEKNTKLIYNKKEILRKIIVYKCFDLRNIIEAPIRSY